MYNWCGSLLLELVILVLIAPDHKWHSNVLIDESSLSLGHQVNLANKPINARTHIAFDPEEG